MVEGDLGDAPTIGAGIVFGLDKGALYVLTANHVVRRGTLEAHSLRVKLKSSPTQSLEAELLSHFDAEGDLAAIRVNGLATQGVDVCKFEFGELEELWQKLKRGFAVHAVGNPNGIGWAMSVTPELVSELTEKRVMFQSTFIGRGDSGGALISDRGHLLGMIQADQPPLVSAILLSSALQTVARWDYPLDLMDSPYGKFGVGGYGTRLVLAAGTGDTRTVQRLLNACWNPNATGGNVTAAVMGEASGHGQLEVVKLLIAAGVDANGLNYGLSHAARTDEVETMEWLLSHGAKADAVQDYGSTPLHSAASAGNVKASKLLLTHGANVNARQTDGATPLYLAVSDKRRDVVELLLASGSPVNTPGQGGKTPLHEAAFIGDPEIVKALLDAGAEVNAKDTWGKTPLGISSDEALEVRKILKAHGGRR